MVASALWERDGLGVAVPMAKGVEVATIGETMVLVAPTPGVRLEAARRCELHAAGAESNVAVHLAALGHRAAWAGRVGDGPLGRFLLADLKQAGVDLTAVTVDPDRPTGVFFRDPVGERTDVYYYRNGSAATAMDAATVAPYVACPPAILHVTGITPALSPSCLDLVRRLVVERLVPGAVVSFDVNLRRSLWPDTGVAAETLQELASAADIVFVGVDEARALWGCEDADAVRSLLPVVGELIVKDGAGQAVWYSGSSSASVEPAEVCEIVDVVGAGDAFAAGWLSGRLRDLAPIDRLRLGHLTAAACLRSPGDRGELPPFSQIAEDLGIEETHVHPVR